MNAPADTPLAQAVIAQAVQGLESTGWLDDAGALRQAAREKPGERPAQYLRRAWLLGERLGLTQALEQARAALGLALIALALAVALAALGLERAALGAERTINAAAALAALLGPHLLALAVWLAALMLPKSIAVDVVHKEQYIAAFAVFIFLITEMLGHRQTGQGNA